MNRRTQGEKDKSSLGDDIRCEVIDTVAGIDAVRDAWTSLQSSLPLPFAKNDVDYFVAEMSRGAAGVKPCVIVVRDREVPKLLVVACMKDIFFKPRIGYIPIGLFAKRPKKCLHVLPYGLLGDSSDRYSRPLVSEMLVMLRKKTIDYVYMSLLPNNSPLMAAARSLPPLFCRDYLPSFEDHYTLKMPESLAAYLKQKNSKTRHRLLGLKKKLQESFGNDIETRWYCNTHDVDEFCIEAEKVAHTSYHRCIGVGFKDTPELRRAKKLEAENGWFCSCILFVKKQPIAFHCGIKYGGSFYGETTAFEKTMEAFNPGTVLNLDLIDKMSEDKNVGTIDFGFGPDEYKKRFGNAQCREVSLRIFAPSLQGYSMNALVTLSEAITRTGRDFARSFGLYLVLKKTVRKLYSRSSQCRP
jgi:hypothetical protein